MTTHSSTYSAACLSFGLMLTGCGGLSDSGAMHLARTLRASDAAFSVVYEDRAAHVLSASGSYGEYAEKMRPYDDVVTAIDGAYKCLLDAVVAEDRNAFGCAPLVGHVITLVEQYASQ
jgi:hypothetical protein